MRNSIKLKTDPSLSDSRVFQNPSLSISTAENCHRLSCTMTKTNIREQERMWQHVEPGNTQPYLFVAFGRLGSVSHTALTLVNLTIKFMLDTRLPLYFVWQLQFYGGQNKLSICGKELCWGRNDVWNRLHPWAMAALMCPGPSECRATRLYWLSSDPWGAERMEDWGYTLWQGKARTNHSGGDAQRMGCNDQWYIRSPESWSLLCLLLCVAVNVWAWLTGFYPFVFPFRRANIGTENSVFIAASKGKIQALTSSEPR